MEHLQHFGLGLDPFQIEPDLRFYYDSGLHRDAQRRVERGLRQSKGLSILTGEGGTGKSLLARRLLGGLEEEVFEAALMVMLPGAADAQSLVKRFARHLEIEDVAEDSAQVMGQVYEQLAVVREEGRHAVLILDDAHLLGPDTLAEVGALLSLEYEDRRLVSILLVGLPELDEDVASDRSLGQRVDVRVRLAPLDLDSTTAYLANRLEVAGGDPAIIPPEAVGALFKHGRGRPRLMNTIADNALFEAYLAGRRQIDASDVERAAGDLGIGPDPGSTYSLEAPPAPVHHLNPEVTAPLAPSGAGALSPDDSGLDLDSLLDSSGEDAEDLGMGLGDVPEGPELNLDMEVAGETPGVDVPVAEPTRLMLGDEEVAFAGLEEGPGASQGLSSPGAAELPGILEDDAVALSSDALGAIELGESTGSQALQGDQHDPAIAPTVDRPIDLAPEPDGGAGVELGGTAAASLELGGTGLELGGTADAGLELGGTAEATRLVLPGEEAGLPPSEGDEIEALFDQLLDE